MDEGNDNSGSGVGRDNICKDIRKVLVLASSLLVPPCTIY